APLRRRHLPDRGALGDDPGLLLQVLPPARLPDGADPPPFRDEGLVRHQDHGPLLDPHLDPLRLRLRPLLPLLLPLLPRRMTVLAPDGGLLGEPLARAGDEDVILVEHSASELERLEREAADPRVFYLIGDPGILPLPDRSVDMAVGDGVEPELRRVVRRN